MSTRTGHSIVATNPYGREERYLIIREENNRAVAADRDGRFQALKLVDDPWKGKVWVSIKFPNHDEAKVWGWANAA